MTIQDLTEEQIDILGDFVRVQTPELPEPKSPQRKTPSPITFRVSDDERAQLQILAGASSVSAYIRRCVFHGDIPPNIRTRQPLIKDQQAIAKLLGLLGETRIANNLNQIAHHANMDKLEVNDTVLSQIEEAYQHVQSMRAALIKALGLIEDV